MVGWKSISFLLLQKAIYAINRLIEWLDSVNANAPNGWFEVNEVSDIARRSGVFSTEVRGGRVVAIRLTRLEDPLIAELMKNPSGFT